MWEIDFVPQLWDSHLHGRHGSVIGWIPGKVPCYANGKNVVDVTLESFQATLEKGKSPEKSQRGKRSDCGSIYKPDEVLLYAD